MTSPHAKRVYLYWKLIAILFGNFYCGYACKLSKMVAMFLANKCAKIVISMHGSVRPPAFVATSFFPEVAESSSILLLTSSDVASQLGSVLVY